jgi:hypothetical protein
LGWESAGVGRVKGKCERGMNMIKVVHTMYEIKIMKPLKLFKRKGSRVNLIEL